MKDTSETSSIAFKVSAKEWALPSVFNVFSEKLCTPSEILFTPISLKASSFDFVIVDGETSTVHSVVGFKEGFTKKLEIQGVGYSANMEGNNLNLVLGFSHPVLVTPPEGVKIAVEANTKITVTGSNKQAVGDVAAEIRGKRPPEVYKGKGVRYEGEYVRRKAGKTGKK